MSKNIAIEKLAQIGSIFICGYHLFSIIAFALRTNDGYTIPSEGSIETQVAVIHSVLLLLLLVYVLTIKNERLLQKVTASLVSLSAIGVYVWWYLEKFSFLTVVYGLSVESPEYKEWLSEMGLLRGASQLEFFVAVVTVILFFYSGIRLVRYLLPGKAYLT